MDEARSTDGPWRESPLRVHRVWTSWVPSVGRCLVSWNATGKRFAINGGQRRRSVWANASPLPSSSPLPFVTDGQKPRDPHGPWGGPRFLVHEMCIYYRCALGRVHWSKKERFAKKEGKQHFVIFHFAPWQTVVSTIGGKERHPLRFPRHRRTTSRSCGRSF